METIDIIVDFCWVEETGDCTKCRACEDLIIGKKFSLILMTSTGLYDGQISNTDVAICESCYDYLDQDLKD